MGPASTFAGSEWRLNLHVIRIEKSRRLELRLLQLWPGGTTFSLGTDILL